MGDEEFFRQLRLHVNTLIQRPNEQAMVYHKMLVELYKRQDDARKQGLTITFQEAMDSFNREFGMKEVNPRE